MSDLEFLGRVKMTRLTSLEEDIKLSQKQFREDDLLNKVCKPCVQSVVEIVESIMREE